MNDNSFNNNSGYSNSPDEMFSIGASADTSDNAMMARNMFTTDEALSKDARLTKAKETKLYALTKLNNGANLDNSYTELEDGRVESNKNKIWNDLSDNEFQSLHAYAQAQKSLSRNGDNTTDAEGNAFLGRTRRFYEFGNKVDASDVVKLGLARGDAPDATARYLEYPSGEMGVNIDRLNSDVLYSNDVATMLEGVTHGRRQALSNRVVKDRYADPFTTDLLGGGSSEYYNSREGVFGAQTEVDMGIGAKLFEEYMAKLPDKYQNYASRRTAASKPLSKPNSLVNAAAGFGATFVNELIVNPLDALGDATGLYDLGTEEEKTESTNNLFGYDDRAAAESIEKIGEHWDVVSDSNQSGLTRAKAAAEGMLEAFTTPEMLGTSLGALMAWVAPGGVLAKIGVGTKYALGVQKIDAAVKAGEITRAVGKTQKAKALLSIDGAKAFVTAQAGFIASSAGNVNNQYEQFVEHNNGVGLTGEDKAKWFAGRFAVQMVNQNLDKIVDFNVMKSPGVFQALVPAVKAMTEKEFGNVVKTMAKGVAKTSLSAGSEAVQEYTQTTMELFNSRFGSEQFKDLDTFTKFLSDSGNIREGGIASLAGAGGSGQFEFVGALGSAVKDVKFKGNEEYTPESEEGVNEVSTVAETQKSFASDNKQKHPVASYYAAQASNDTDAKAEAKSYSDNVRDTLLDGSSTVFRSDKPTSIEDVSRMVEVAISGNPEQDYTTLKNAIKSTMESRGETFTEVEAKQLDNARKKGVITARVKNMLEVADEVSAGLGGFTTYYAAAKAAENIGDVKAQTENISKLSSFMQYEGEKAARIKSKLEEVEGLVMSEAQVLVDNKKASDINEALRMKGVEYGKKDGRVTTVKNADKVGAKTTEISHYSVALKLRTQDSQKPFAGDIYNLLTTINNEVDEMGKVYSQLFEVSQEQTTTTPVVESSEAVVEQVNSVTFPDDVQGWLDSNTENPYAKMVAARTADSTITKDQANKAINNVRGRIEREAAKAPTPAPVKEPETATSAIVPTTPDAVTAARNALGGKTGVLADKMRDAVGNIWSRMQTVGVGTNTETFEGIVKEETENLDELAVKTLNSVLSRISKLQEPTPVVEEVVEPTAVEGEHTDESLAAMLREADGDYSDDTSFSDDSFSNPTESSLEDELSAANFDNEALMDEFEAFTNDNTGFDDENLSFSNDDMDDTFIDTDKVFDGVTLDFETFKEFRKRPERKVEEKLEEVERLQNIKEELQSINAEISEHRDYLRGLPEFKNQKETPDSELNRLMTIKKLITNDLESFENSTQDHISDRLTMFRDGTFTKSKLTLFKHWVGKNVTEQKYTLKDIFSGHTVTGFNVQKETSESVLPETAAYGERLKATVPVEGSGYFNGIERSITGFLLYGKDGELNYNTVQAMHASVNDYVLRNSENLYGATRDTEEYAKILGVSEEDITPDDMMALMQGGVTLRLAASEVGKTIIKNLGIRSSTIAIQNALATHLGIAAIQGSVGHDGHGMYNEVLTRTRTGQKATNINLIKGDDTLMGTLGTMSDTNKSIEERLKVEVNTKKTYRKSKKAEPRKVQLRNAEYLNAPKDHTDVVNRLENTAFKFNSGKDTLFEIFSDGNNGLDKEALMDKIIGSETEARNKDDADSYGAQRIALKRSLDNFTESVDDVGDAEIFFDWFIARNHRIHLDSSGINPQGDKQIARWLLTASGVSVDINKDLIESVVNGEHEGDMSHEVMVAKTFAYSIVQAFDGADDIPGVDKDTESVILDKAKQLLDRTYTEEEMFGMAKSSRLAHVGHAALAIANIRKFKDDKGVLTSDMVIEVDGLTNGFAFRAMQYPVGSAKYTKEWLEKVGVIDAENSNVGTKDGKPLSELKSMNDARTTGLEDVYISTGKVMGTNIDAVKSDIVIKSKGAKFDEESEAEVEQAKQDISWINLFEKHKKLPDFSAGFDGVTNESKDLLKFIRNLMKNPVMIFGYAAGIKSIVAGLVNDQLLGRNYLSGKGLVSYLTAIDPDTEDYYVPEAELKKLFKVKGESYHQARINLMNDSLMSKTDGSIIELRQDLQAAITALYAEPLENTLTELFSEQTKVNAALIQAGEFLFKYFDEAYQKHIARNPHITEEGKTEWLKTFATIIPGIAGASSTDQRTKLAFLKNVLDNTGDDVRVKLLGREELSGNTVTRGYGEPGVGPAVLTILSLDSSNLAMSINEFYKDNDYADVVPVHDAMVFGVGAYGLAKQYSKDFYLTNKRYSIVEEFNNAINAMEIRLGDNAKTFSIKGFDDDVSFAAMKSNLQTTVNTVRKGREELYAKKLNIGQMVHLEMYTADPKQDKIAATEYIKELSGRISKLMKDPDLKKALGTKYRTHKKHLETMLKGCK